MSDEKDPQAEYDRLRTKLSDIDDAIIRDYSRAAFIDAQIRVRSAHRNDPDESVRVWMATKARMLAEKDDLVREKIAVQKAIQSVKASRHRRLTDGGPVQVYKADVVQQVVDGQTEVASLLRSILVELVKVRDAVAAGKDEGGARC